MEVMTFLFVAVLAIGVPGAAVYTLVRAMKTFFDRVEADIRTRREIRVKESERRVQEAHAIRARAETEQARASASAIREERELTELKASQSPIELLVSGGASGPSLEMEELLRMSRRYFVSSYFALNRALKNRLLVFKGTKTYRPLVESTKEDIEVCNTLRADADKVPEAYRDAVAIDWYDRFLSRPDYVSQRECIQALAKIATIIQSLRDDNGEMGTVQMSDFITNGLTVTLVIYDAVLYQMKHFKLELRVGCLQNIGDVRGREMALNAINRHHEEASSRTGPQPQEGALGASDRLIANMPAQIKQDAELAADNIATLEASGNALVDLENETNKQFAAIFDRRTQLYALIQKQDNPLELLHEVAEIADEILRIDVPQIAGSLGFQVEPGATA